MLIWGRSPVDEVKSSEVCDAQDKKHDILVIFVELAGQSMQIQSFG